MLTLKMIQMNLFMKQKQYYIHIKQMYGYRRERWERGMHQESGINIHTLLLQGFPGSSWLPSRRHGFSPWIRKIPRRTRQPTPVFLPGTSRGQRSLAGYNPWVHKELDMTQQTDCSSNILFIKYIIHEDLLYSTGNSTRYSVII